MERALGEAFRRREATERTIATRSGSVRLDHAVDPVVTAATVNEVALTTDQVEALRQAGPGPVITGGPWVPGDELVLTVTHGHEEPPAGGVRICGEFVRAKALATVGNLPRNTISYQDAESGTTFRESTAHWAAGRYTGLRVVDDWINAQRTRRWPGMR